MRQQANIELQPVTDAANELFSQYKKRKKWSYSESEENSLLQRVNECALANEKRVNECTPPNEKPADEKRVQDTDVLLAFIIYIYKKKHADSNNLSWIENEQIYRKIRVLEKAEDDGDDDSKQIEYLQEIERYESEYELECKLTNNTKSKLEEYISCISLRKKEDHWLSHCTFVILGHAFYFGHSRTVKETAANAMSSFLSSTDIYTAIVSKVSLQHLYALKQGQLGTIFDQVPKTKRTTFLEKACLNLIEEYIKEREKADISTKYSFLYGSYTIFGYTIYACHTREVKIQAAKLLKLYLTEYTLPEQLDRNLQSAVQYGRLGGIFKQIPEPRRQAFLEAESRRQEFLASAAA